MINWPSVWSLFCQLTARDIQSRFRGSLIGVAWMVLLPVALLVIYTFAFSEVFKARWPGGSESKLEYALVLFAGLMLLNFLTDCLTRAPTVIVANAAYVKKVVFPLFLLPLVAVASAGITLIVNLLIWLVFCAVLWKLPPLSAFSGLLLLLPLLLLGLSVSYVLSALGVYVRDLNHVLGLVSTMLMFLSPVFYPVSAVPLAFQSVMHLNPLTPLIEQFRAAMMWGIPVDLGTTSLILLFCALALGAAVAFFSHLRTGFADVI
jgi:lipopolysaccharide transport system permease protein